MFLPSTTRSSEPVIPISFITGMASDNTGENSSVIAAIGILGSSILVSYTKAMFFRRERPKVPTFNERVELLKKAGFDLQKLQDGRIRITQHGIGAVIGDEGKNQPAIEKAGVLVGSDVATLLNAGYQMFLEVPSGKRYPATAEQLRALHQFEDDVKE